MSDHLDGGTRRAPRLDCLGPGAIRVRGDFSDFRNARHLLDTGRFRRGLGKYQRAELHPRRRFEGRDGLKLDPDDYGDRRQGLADNPKVSPETFAGSIVGFKSACPDSFTALGFGAAKFGDCAHCRGQRQCRLLHATMGRARADIRQSPHRRGQMAGAAAPVAADPGLPDRSRRAVALPELRQPKIVPAGPEVPFC